MLLCFIIRGFGLSIMIFDTFCFANPCGVIVPSESGFTPPPSASHLLDFVGVCLYEDGIVYLSATTGIWIEQFCSIFEAFSRLANLYGVIIPFEGGFTSASACHLF